MNYKLLLAAVLATATTTVSFAMNHAEQSAADYFAMMDADADGMISIVEFIAAHEQKFMMKDTNSDGMISMEEHQAGMGMMQEKMEEMPKHMGKHMGEHMGDDMHHGETMGE